MLDRKIEYFIEVVEKGSFSSSARSFLLSQSAVSQQIALLENELNIQLFDRTGYKFVAKNPHACVWDESHISLDIYLEKNI